MLREDDTGSLGQAAGFSGSVATGSMVPWQVHGGTIRYQCAPRLRNLPFSLLRMLIQATPDRRQESEKGIRAEATPMRLQSHIKATSMRVASQAVATFMRLQSHPHASLMRLQGSHKAPTKPGGGPRTADHGPPPDTGATDLAHATAARSTLGRLQTQMARICTKHGAGRGDPPDTLRAGQFAPRTGTSQPTLCPRASRPAPGRLLRLPISILNGAFTL